MVVALFMAVLVFAFHLFGLELGSIWNDAARIVLFGLVSFFIGSVRDHERAERKAQEEAETKRQELTELAEKQEEQLEHSTRLAELGEMAAAISHELNQPLTGIRNYARNAFYMLEQSVGSVEEVKGNLRLISEQVDRAAKIINEMRELARKEERYFTPLAINSVIRETADFLVPQMRLSGVQVEFQLSEDLPDVKGDRTRLAQIFLNLLANARQAMEESPIRRLGIHSFVDPGDRHFVIVDISDTGKGFSAEEAQKLFVPFFTTKKSGHGTGLGLSISKAIIKDHGGSIEARGAIGQGATFSIRLPAIEEEDEGEGEKHA
jgi:C4-dicarboxylate-specific signal transduction histidine kinase